MLTLKEIATPPIDSETGQPWPKWIDTAQAARYGTQILGISIEPQTLANYRAAGKGPRWKYFGQKPLTTPAEIERWVTEEALTDESPLTRRARERAERLGQRAQPTATKEITSRGGVKRYLRRPSP
jgi:hypothetical protein